MNERMRTASEANLKSVAASTRTRTCEYETKSMNLDTDNNNNIYDEMHIVILMTYNMYTKYIGLIMYPK